MKDLICKVGSVTIFLLLFLSCQFEPSGDNYVEIEQEIKSWLEEYELSEIPEDEAIIYPIRVNYSFAVGNGKFYLINVTLGGADVFTSDLAAGSFEIAPVVLPNRYGTLELVVSVYTSTATNSLADQVRAEAVVYQLRKQLKFDSRPAELNPFEILETDSALILKLGSYPNENLHSNTIYASSDPARLFEETNKLAVLNRGKSIYADQAYVGGTMFYGVETKAYSNLSEDTKRSAPVKVNTASFPMIDESNSLPNGTLEVQWSKAPYQNSFNRYELQWWLNYENPMQKIVLDNIDDTTYILEHLPLGDSVNVSIRTINALGKGVSKSSTVILGNPDIKFDRLLVDASNPDFKLNYDESKSLLEVIGADREITIVLDEVHFSKSNNLIATYSSSAIKLLDYPSLNLVDEINPKDFYANPYNSPLKELVILDDKHLIYTNPATKVIDFKSKTENFSFYSVHGINYFESSGNIAITHRDHSGAQNAFVVDLYKFENDTLEFQNRRHQFTAFSGSFSLGNALLLLVKGDSYQILNLPSLTSVASHTLETGDYIHKIDPITRWALVSRYFDDVATFGILELMTGKILYEFPATSNGIHEYSLIDGVLYRGNGYSIKLRK